MLALCDSLGFRSWYVQIRLACLPILCYHKVGPVTEEGRWLNIEPTRLESHVTYFKRRGRRFVLSGELVGRLPADSVMLTFDDAYASVTENAFPVLRRHEVKAALFVVTGFVGKASEWDGPKARPLANWDALMAARAEGIELGSHSHGHNRLAELADEEQRFEIEEARQLLAERGVAADSFCYPYGSWNKSALANVAKCGYRVAFALGKRPAQECDDRLALPRIVVSCSDVLPKLLYKIHIRPFLPR